MKNLIIGFIVLLSFNAFAQEEGKSVYLKKGETAPFNGILLDSQSQAQMMAQKEFDKKKCELDNQYNLLKMRATCDLEVGKLKIELDIEKKKYETIMNIKDQEIKKLNEIAVKESGKSDRWIWWLIGGIASGMVVTIGITYAVNR